MCRPIVATPETPSSRSVVPEFVPFSTTREYDIGGNRLGKSLGARKSAGSHLIQLRSYRIDLRRKEHALRLDVGRIQLAD